MLVLKWSSLGYHVKDVCRIVGLSRASFYANTVNDDGITRPNRRESTGRAPEYSKLLTGGTIGDSEIKYLIKEASNGEGYNYGYRKMTYLLRRRKKVFINHKKVYRLCKELKILRPPNRLKRRISRRLAQNRIVTAPNQLWQGDIKYGYIKAEDRTFYILSYIDVFDRSIVGYTVGLACKGKHACEALRQGLLKRNIYGGKNLPIVRTDNGPQFTGLEFAALCDELMIEHERIPPRTPNMNAYIEAYHSILEDDFMRVVEFKGISDVKLKLARYVKYYNQVRIHSSIQYYAPDEYHHKWQVGEVIGMEIHL